MLYQENPSLMLELWPIVTCIRYTGRTCLRYHVYLLWAFAFSQMAVACLQYNVPFLSTGSGHVSWILWILLVQLGDHLQSQRRMLEFICKYFMINKSFVIDGMVHDCCSPCLYELVPLSRQENSDGASLPRKDSCCAGFTTPPRKNTFSSIHTGRRRGIRLCWVLYYTVECLVIIETGKVLSRSLCVCLLL